MAADVHQAHNRRTVNGEAVVKLYPLRHVQDMTGLLSCEIHYAEDIGLITPTRVQTGKLSRRLFSQQDIEILQHARRQRIDGMSWLAIKAERE